MCAHVKDPTEAEKNVASQNPALISLTLETDSSAGGWLGIKHQVTYEVTYLPSYLLTRQLEVDWA